MIYLLFYDTDTGAKEEWNTFYTPCLAFESEALRDQKEAELASDPSLSFYTLDLKVERFAEPQRSISGLFIYAMHRLEKKKILLSEFLQLVDLTAKAVPGDEKQQRFYDAMKTLAKKVWASQGLLISL